MKKSLAVILLTTLAGCSQAPIYAPLPPSPPPKSPQAVNPTAACQAVLATIEQMNRRVVSEDTNAKLDRLLAESKLLSDPACVDSVVKAMNGGK